ncbi:hypothetical protein DITRI_Ditri01bG0053800 [Diplodiscus trichospermus]
MSSPHLESVPTILEAIDDLWPLSPENNSNLVLQPSTFHCQAEGRNINGKGLLAENRNDNRKDDKEDAFSTSIQAVLEHQWSFPRGSSSSPPIMDNGINGNKLDSVLVLEHEISPVLPDYKHCHPNSEISGLLPPISASDYACSLLQGSSTSLPIEDNARTNELYSSTFILEPVYKNIDEGSLPLDSELHYPIDDSLSAPPEGSDEIDLLLQESSSLQLPGKDEKTRDINDQTDCSLVPEQESSAAAEPSCGKGLNIAKRVSTKTRGRNYRLKHVLQTENKEVQADKGEGSTVKKQEHNAKERMRRMKLHASYLSLEALLPDSGRSKKRKSAPLIIDRAVEYIPEMEEEIEKLTLRKNDMLSTIKSKQPVNQNPHLQLQDPSVSVHEIRQGEVIVQIYTQEHPDAAFSNLLQKIEEEGMCIVSASTLQVSDDGVCYHLHIQVHMLSFSFARH